MSATRQARAPALDDLRLFAYAQHMVKTARSEVARRLFERYVEQEQTWLTQREARVSDEGLPGGGDRDRSVR